MDWEKKRKYEAMKPSTTEQRNNEYLNYIVYRETKYLRKTLNGKAVLSNWPFKVSGFF